MGPLTISTWIRLDAFFAALALWLLLGPRWVPQRPGEERTLWIKLGVFFLVVHATLAVIGLGGPWLKAAMAAVAAAGSRELTLALLGPGNEQRPYRWLAMGGAVAIVCAAGPGGGEVQVLVVVLLAGASTPVLLERPAGARASAGAVALTALLQVCCPPRYTASASTTAASQRSSSSWSPSTTPGPKPSGVPSVAGRSALPSARARRSRVFLAGFWRRRGRRSPSRPFSRAGPSSSRPSRSSRHWRRCWAT